MHNGIAGLAGGVKDLETWSPTLSLLGELPPIHSAWKPNIREEQGHFAIGIQQSECGCPIGSTQYRISKLTHHVDRVVTHIGVILNDKNQFPLTARDIASRQTLIRHVFLTAISRQIKFNSRSLSDFAIELYMAARLLDEPVDL